MSNISHKQRDAWLHCLQDIKKTYPNSDNLTVETLETLDSLISFIQQPSYGLVWEQHSEPLLHKLNSSIPIFYEVVNKRILNTTSSIGNSKDACEPEEQVNNGINFILEGDNLHSLHLLNKTHQNTVDVIYIDPPYNRGDNDFIYDDDFFDKTDSFRHSRWLSFMHERLLKAYTLLNETGVIIINIDENEKSNLHLLMNQVFGEKNGLGEIIWNKKNPKGDAKGIACMHETILVFAKNKAQFLTLKNTCQRKKKNAEKMIDKANALFKKMGKKQLPVDIAQAIKPFNYPKEKIKDFYVTYTLELINQEFKSWLTKQDFSNGEKAYKYIDESGRVYRGVSMAWPNKKQAPDNYFIPLLHPVTQKACPIPKRGWRNSPATMQQLLEDKLILFGKDHHKQPERKYYLDENMYENTPSIYENADSADKMLKQMEIRFEYAKPLSEAMYVLNSIHPKPSIILDFFAGSGTTGHAVQALNQQDNGSRQYILCSNNQNNICEKATYQRMLSIQQTLPHTVHYFKTDFIPKSTELEGSKMQNNLSCLQRLSEQAHLYSQQP